MLNYQRVPRNPIEIKSFSPPKGCHKLGYQTHSYGQKKTHILLFMAAFEALHFLLRFPAPICATVQSSVCDHEGTILHDSASLDLIGLVRRLFGWRSSFQLFCATKRLGSRFVLRPLGVQHRLGLWQVKWQIHHISSHFDTSHSWSKQVEVFYSTLLDTGTSLTRCSFFVYGFRQATMAHVARELLKKELVSLMKAGTQCRTGFVHMAWQNTNKFSPASHHLFPNSFQPAVETVSVYWIYHQIRPTWPMSMVFQWLGFPHIRKNRGKQHSNISLNLGIPPKIAKFMGKTMIWLATW